MVIGQQPQLDACFMQQSIPTQPQKLQSGIIKLYQIN